MFLIFVILTYIRREGESIPTLDKGGGGGVLPETLCRRVDPARSLHQMLLHAHMRSYGLAELS